MDPKDVAAPMEEQPPVVLAPPEQSNESAFPQWLSFGMSVEILGEEEGEARLSGDNEPPAS